MPFVYNGTSKERSVCAQGNWFTFKPKQIRNIASANLALFLTSNLAHEGLVRLPEEFEDPSYGTTEQGKKDLADASDRAVAARANFLQSLVNNELVSLKSDLARTNNQSDPKSFMSAGMVENMKELASIKSVALKEKKDKIAEIEALEKAINS